MADWENIKAEYLTTETSYRKLAKKYGVNATTIAKKASKEGWQSQRQQQATKTLSKMLAADTKQKVDRATRLKTVADKLLDKVEALVEEDGFLSAAAIKNLSDALKNIKEAQMIRSSRDDAEQDARIAKLQREAQKDADDGKDKTVHVIIAGGEGSWQR